jgi:hypothetical protein
VAQLSDELGVVRLPMLPGAIPLVARPSGHSVQPITA